ncbi:FAD-dependent monooxygenase [Dactylosporangium vinaceum]|uniref:FAD-dependent oxidoreductase n=1 Tax=Dactylosporangium vinaceum TaxID=53362 RepID=A0ABV5MHF0_9ACTN|nr:NAD(P)/FAD-dependent oxidoreductase [Dactylosporangium vinaceum]UAB94785.1 FAD-dependent monooxygenase [Dactylosporangium vinaceum]
MRAIVIGGGVGGAAAALALRRIGAEVTVYEAYADPAGDVGAWVSLAANGLRAVDALGGLAAVRAAGFEIERQRMWSAGGMLIGDVPRGRRSSDTLRSVTLMRARLVAALRAAAVEAGAAIVTGARLVGAGETGGGVRVTLEGGATDTADVLVAADGIWSTVRGLLDPAAPVPQYAGLYSVSGVSRLDGVDPGVFNLTFARNGAFLHVRAGDEVWWSAQVTSPVAPPRVGVDDAVRLRELSRLYAEEVVPATILAATTSLQPTAVMHVLDPVATWHSDRIVIIGDAAHPVGAGQGASMAIEDALALAAALQRAPSVAEALRRYDAERRPRITKILSSAEDNRSAKRAGPVRRRLQAALMRIFVPMFYEKATAWLYAYEPAELAK